MALNMSWDQFHRVSFPEWLNYYLNQRNLKVDDIERDFCDGVLLINLLEIISQKKIKRYFANPKFLQHKIDNVNVSLQFLQNEMGLTVVGCNPQDIVNGNTKQIMGIIFLLIQYTKHHKTDDEPNKLLIEISNFSKHLGTDLNLYLEKDLKPANENSDHSSEILTPKDSNDGELTDEEQTKEEEGANEDAKVEPSKKKKSRPKKIKRKKSEVLNSSPRGPAIPQRDIIANEILTTERSYVNGLNILINSFLEPAKAKSILSPADIRRIFSDIELLKGINEQLLSLLEERMKSWQESNERLGDIFAKLCDYMKMYTNYVNNYNESIKAVTECKKKSQKFAEFLETTRYTPECNGLDLTSFLIMPVQRIPRYVLLLSDLLKSTSEEHSDYEDLKKALERMKRVADYVNEKKREAENLNQVLEVQEALAGKIELLEDASRRYVREGPLVDMSGNEKRNRYYFLFNDLLVEATQSTKEYKEIWKKLETAESNNIYRGSGNIEGIFKYKSSIPVGNSGLKEPGPVLQKSDPKWKNMFQLATPLVPTGALKKTSHRQQLLSFLAPTYEIKLNWMHDIDECIMQQLETKRTRLQSNLEENEHKFEPNARFEIASKLLLQSSKGEYKSRWCVIQNGSLFIFVEKEDAEPKKSVCVVNCSTRLHRPSEREFSFQVLTSTRIYIFVAESGELLFEWVNNIRSSIEYAINTKSNPSSKSRSNTLPPAISNFLSQPGNQVCVDCAQVGPRWVSLTMGIFLCPDCSGIHRIFGQNMKCLNFGLKLTDQQVELILSKGNDKSNEELQKNIPPFMSMLEPHASYTSRVQFIQAKYNYNANIPESSEPQNNNNNNPNNANGRNSDLQKTKSFERKKIYKKGWLLLSKDKSKLQYFFVLKKTHINYYKTEKGGAVKGTIDLQGATTSLSKEEPYDTFEIISPSRVFQLTAGSSDEAKSWVENIGFTKQQPTKKKGIMGKLQTNSLKL